jgi:hypothetical protein
VSTKEEHKTDSPTAAQAVHGDLSDTPEPDEEDKKKAAEMMDVYDEDKPTLVMPGSGGAISGTTVGDWLDENGDPKYGKDRPAEDAKAADDDAEADDETPHYMSDELIAKDKELNAEIIKHAEATRHGEAKDRAKHGAEHKDGATDEATASK